MKYDIESHHTQSLLTFQVCLASLHSISTDILEVALFKSLTNSYYFPNDVHEIPPHSWITWIIWRESLLTINVWMLRWTWSCIPRNSARSSISWGSLRFCSKFVATMITEPLSSLSTHPTPARCCSVNMASSTLISKVPRLRDVHDFLLKLSFVMISNIFLKPSKKKRAWLVAYFGCTNKFSNTI